MIEHQITYTCDECGLKQYERYGHPIGELYNPPLRNPCTPSGWQVLQGRLLCPAHEVLVTIASRRQVTCTS